MSRVARLALVLVLGAATTAWAQEPPSPRDPVPPRDVPRATIPPSGSVGSNVVDLTPGDPAPDFQLDSSLGQPLTRADLMGHWSVIVFDRGRSGFRDFGSLEDAMHDLDAKLVGFCQDGEGALGWFARQNHLDFPLLSDPTGETAQLFGMWDDDTSSIQPGLVILDERGMVRTVLQSDALHPGEVLAIARHAIRGD